MYFVIFVLKNILHRRTRRRNNQGRAKLLTSVQYRLRVDVDSEQQILLDIASMSPVDERQGIGDSPKVGQGNQFIRVLCQEMSICRTHFKAGTCTSAAAECAGEILS
ncbi:MAG: hypothetical protein ACK58T_27850, partial [Phycisphaerae bacterium]